MPQGARPLRLRRLPAPLAARPRQHANPALSPTPIPLPQGVREGATLRDIHELSVALLSKAIASLGLVRGASADAVAKGPYRRFYPHSVGHWLGLDVHDTPGCARPLHPPPASPRRQRAPPAAAAQGARCEGERADPRICPPARPTHPAPAAPRRVPLSQPLRPGVVLTIEPGLYVPMDAEGVPDGALLPAPRGAIPPAAAGRKVMLVLMNNLNHLHHHDLTDFRGLGVRIEDDVLVTKGKPEVLSGAAPVGAAAMEAFAEEGRRRFPWLAAQAREALGAAPQDR